MSQDDQNNVGVDLGEFLEFYLLDSHEQIEKLGSGLLQLEKEGNNITLINELFRSAHSLKGASGTMGFTPIVALTHAAEDLLDRLRQGKTEVTMNVIDVLLAVTDQVKAMLEQVGQNQEIDVEFADLVAIMKEIISGEQDLSVSKSGSLGENELVSPEEKALAPVGELADVFIPANFALTSAEFVKLENTQAMGHGIYQIDVTLAPDTVMKAVRAVMAIQRAGNMGTVVKSVPSPEEMETGNTEKFSLLLISDDVPAEIREEILNVSEVTEVLVSPYPFGDSEIKDMEETRAVIKPVEATGTLEPGVKEQAKKAEAADDSKEKPESSAALTAVTPPSGASAEGGNQVHTIRVDTARMDSLINMVGEMVITRTRLVQIGMELKNAYEMDPQVNNLVETNAYLGRLMNDLQESVMRLRMVPIGTVFSRFPRLVRDLARKTNKEIELVVKGEDTELDKTVVEVIGDPLMHLIRNSVDHGIESPAERQAAGKPAVGTITLDAYHEGNHIAIFISDDGAGLPLEKIIAKAIQRGLIDEREELSDRDIANLIFLPGFSTAEKITDISGRGVGMDVVKKALTNLGGTIDIDTRRGEGTTFIIRLPLTLAIIQALLVEVGEEIYAIPLASVLETLLVERKDVKTVGGLPMVQLRGNTLPLISLQEKFELPAPEQSAEEVYVVVVGLGEKAVGLIVGGLRGQQEIVIKSLGDALGNLAGIAGATILGDGKVTLILDVASLIQDILVKRKS